jgi:hypothetical protein
MTYTTVVDIAWLGETPTGGALPAGSSVPVAVTFDSTGLAVGDYLARLQLRTEDPVNGRIDVPATLHVVEALDFLHLYKMKMNQRPAMQAGWNKVITLGIVHDQAHNKPAGVMVAGNWTYSDGSVVPGVPVGPTDALGRFRFRIKVPQCGLFQFDVTGMTKAGYTYDPGANETPTHIEITVPCK